MFIREKKFRNQKYYYLVEAFKDGNKPKQKVIKYLGKPEQILEKMSIAEHCSKNHRKALFL